LENNAKQKELQSSRIMQAQAGVQAAGAEIAQSGAAIEAAQADVANAQAGVDAAQAKIPTLKRRSKLHRLTLNEHFLKENVKKLARIGLRNQTKS